jgi:YVTN family beta-propeller protein
VGVLALTAGTLVVATGAGPATAASPDTTYAVVDTIPFSSRIGDSIGMDPVHHTAYVSNPGSNEVSVVDLTTDAVTGTIPVPGPGRIAVDGPADRAYVVSAGSTVTVIDTVHRTVDRTIPGFSNPIGVSVDPTTHLVYVTNYESQHVSVVDTTRSDNITDTDIVDSRPWAVDVDPTTHRAYASTLFGGVIGVVSGTEIIHRIPGTGDVIQVTADPVGRRVYLVANNGSAVEVIDTGTADGTDTRIQDITAGPAPSDVAVDSSTGTLFVTNRGDDSVSVIDQATGDVVQTVPVGYYPVGVEVDPTTHRVYVVNSDSTMSVISPFATQAITFTSPAPSDATVGGSSTVTATGGGSGQPVTFSVDRSSTQDACSLDGAEVSFDHAGTCVLAAHQPGDHDYAPAPTATQTFTVSLDPTTTTVTVPATGVVFGEPAATAVDVTGTHAGTVQLTLDGDPVGDPLDVDVDGHATAPDLTGLPVGAHAVGADFTPSDGDTYAASSATPQTLVVDKAATTSTVVVAADHLTATVTPTSPGAGTPTGTVAFSVGGDLVGTAPLDGGTASLAHAVPAGSDRHVSTAYAGDDSFTGSSASTARRDPVVTATLSSPTASRHGWWSTPVTVTFHCQATSSPLTASCPAPVTLSRNAAGQSVTRTVTAVDGGAATAVVSGIRVDRVRPVARLTRVRAGATYFATGPTAHCRARDALSGVDTCTVTRSTHGRQVTWVATATDQAGNTSRARVTARTTRVFISGAAVRGGHFVVHRGRTYTVLVAAGSRPRYVYAAPAPRRPAAGRWRSSASGGTAGPWA